MRSLAASAHMTKRNAYNALLATHFMNFSHIWLFKR